MRYKGYADGEFEIVVFLHSHYQTGEEHSYNIWHVSGEEIPWVVLARLLEHDGKDKPLSALFEDTPSAYTECSLDNSYRVTVFWAIEEGTEPLMSLKAIEGPLTYDTE